MRVARDERMKAYPRAQPSRTSLSRDGVARTIHAKATRGARSLSPHWHGVGQADVMLSARIQARSRHTLGETRTSSLAKGTSTTATLAGVEGVWSA